MNFHESLNQNFPFKLKVRWTNSLTSSLDVKLYLCIAMLFMIESKQENLTVVKLLTVISLSQRAFDFIADRSLRKVVK